jgi:hypothetical protein
MHRGSAVSLASEQEIREIECKETILEEDEDDEPLTRNTKATESKPEQKDTNEPTTTAVEEDMKALKVSDPEEKS